MCVRENGDVSPCIQFNLVYGNLLKQDTDDIFHYKRVLHLMNFKEPDLATCKDCPEVYSCGGCVALAYDIPMEICKWKKNHPEIIEQFDRINLRRRT